jgi:hypothetical protein
MQYIAWNTFCKFNSYPSSKITTKYEKVLIKNTRYCLNMAETGSLAMALSATSYT